MHQPSSPAGQAAPIVGITMGDPAGIGPEVILKACADPSVRTVARTLIIGDAAALDRTRTQLDLPLAMRAVGAPGEARFQEGALDVLDLANVDLTSLVLGKVQAIAGRAAVACVQKAVELALAGNIGAICTAPLNKEAIRAAGHTYPGHTEILAELTGTRDYAMLLIGERLRVAHVTTHVGLEEACGRIRAPRIETVIRLAHATLRSMGIPRPRVAVAGLNPHAGENGLFGDEEQREIAPAVAAVAAAGFDVTGPLPPDTVFRRAYAGEFDIVVAMYHDQGHIPIKLVHFADAVNVTAGLPIIRTSVDHGTAFDIAGRGVADPQNMVAAIRLAAQLAQVRPVRSLH